MTITEFGIEMDRLKKLFGSQSYPDERVALIFREVNAFPAEAFKRVVDELIGSHHKAPLLPDFRKVIAVEREQINAVLKRRQAEDAKAFQEWMRTKSAEEITAISEKIRKRVSGNLSDADYDELLKTLNEPNEEEPDAGPESNA